MKSTRRVSPLKAAHKMEVKGSAFYLKLAVGSKNSLTKKLFYTLAQREIDHAARIDELFEKAEDKAPILASAPETAGSVESEIKSFFKKLDKSGLKEGSQLSGYKFALDMEKESIKLYSGLAEKAKNRNEKEFYSALVVEEKEHYDAIQNVYNYLANTGDWMQEEESRVWNWMNF